MQYKKTENAPMDPPCVNIYIKNYKELNNSEVTAEIIDSRIAFLTANNGIENKLRSGKSLYFTKNQNVSKRTHTAQHFC